MGDVALRWTVTILFGASVAMYAYTRVAQQVRWASKIDHLLHLAMSAAMILMAWGVGMSLPTFAPIVFFVLAGSWFAYAAGRMGTGLDDRLTKGYHAVMMAAMAWMFAAMNGGIARLIGPSSDRAESPEPAIDMAGMNMTTHNMAPPHPATEWIAAVNWMAALGFAVVTVFWACRYAAARRNDPGPPASQSARLEPLYQACTAAGTALMFGALL